MIKEKFDLFFQKWNGKTADFDGYYGGQCYDLAQFWTRELGGHLFVGLYAKDIYSQPKDFYTQIPNTPDAVPQVGDIVVWAGSYNGGVGHVAIATGKGDTKTFEVFSQNDPTGAKCILKTYKYSHVIGWLRAKIEDSCKEKDAKIAELSELVVKYKSERDEKDKKYEDCKREKAKMEQEKNDHIQKLQNSYNLANESATANSLELNKVRIERDDIKKELSDLKIKFAEKETDLNNLNNEMSLRKEAEKMLKDRVKTLEKEVKSNIKDVSVFTFFKIKIFG